MRNSSKEQTAKKEISERGGAAAPAQRTGFGDDRKAGYSTSNGTVSCSVTLMATVWFVSRRRRSGGRRRCVASDCDTNRFAGQRIYADLCTRSRTESNRAGGHLQNPRRFRGRGAGRAAGKKGANFVTWEWDFDRNGVHMGHYFIEDYAGAKRDFAARSRLIEPQRLFFGQGTGCDPECVRVCIGG